MKTLENIDVRGKYVLLRDDFNVQIVDGVITDSFRIDASMKTIQRLVDGGARVVICAHLGRPKGEKNPELSLRVVAEYMDVPFIDDCLRKDFLADMKDGDVVLMENLRFYKGEEENSTEFAKKLAMGFDIYVNDAFAVSHRAAASLVAITDFLPSYAGDLLVSEIENISRIMEKPKRPLLVFIGGSKVSTKMGVLKKFVSIADQIVIGGAMGTTFNFANGLPVGDSLYEESMAEFATEIMKDADKKGCEIFLPLDKGVAKTFEKDAKRTNRDATQIKDDDIIIDDGEKTSARNLELLKGAKTVIWNGTFGMAEWGEVWGYSSFNLAHRLAKLTKEKKLESLVGGGDTVACLDACGVHESMTYVSTGGGAFLEFIEGKELPGVVVLNK